MSGCNCLCNQKCNLFSKIQYVGKTSQGLRNALNNHRQKLRQLMYDLFIPTLIFFFSNGYSKDDIAIMPIEEVFLEDGECLSLASKQEEYWYKELATICPYGLNDNVKKVGKWEGILRRNC